MGNRCFVPFVGGEIIMMNVPFDPGGGVEWEYTVPVGYEMTLLAVYYELTTSAIVGSRNTGFIFRNNFDAARERVRLRFSPAMIESRTWLFNLWLGNSRTALAVAGSRVSDALPLVRCGNPYGWGSDCGLLVGDVWNFVRQVVIRWRV